MLKLTPAERSTLRAEAHALSPIVIIGEAGLTPAVTKEIDPAAIVVAAMLGSPQFQKR